MLYFFPQEDEVFLFEKLFDKLDISAIMSGYRTIEDAGYIIYRKEMRDKMRQEDSKKIYFRRAGIAEPAFGQIKNNRAFTRFRLKGLKKVQGELTIMAIVHNLSKMMKRLNGDIQMTGCYA